MKRESFFVFVFFLMTILFHSYAHGEPLQGLIDQASGTNWQSSYMDLDPPRDFRQGERLVVRVQGTAEWVLVRLLPYNASADKPTGLLGEKIRIPPGGELQLPLKSDNPRVRQVSVHAGKEAFGKSLGAKNGEVQIISINILPR